MHRELPYGDSLQDPGYLREKVALVHRLESLCIDGIDEHSDDPVGGWETDLEARIGQDDTFLLEPSEHRIRLEGGVRIAERPELDLLRADALADLPARVRAVRIDKRLAWLELCLPVEYGNLRDDPVVARVGLAVGDSRDDVTRVRHDGAEHILRARQVDAADE